MKKLVFTILGLFLTVFVFGQGTISFYTNNGTKKVTQLKCGEYDDLMVKLTVPSYAKSYDRVSLRVFLSSINSYASILYDGKGDVAMLTSKPKMQKWILKPGKQKGDFSFGDGNLGIYDLCGYPRSKALPSINVDVQLVGLNKTGVEKKWDDFHKKWKYYDTYTKGKVLAKGKMVIKELPPQTGFVSDNGVVKIKKTGGNLSKIYIIGGKEEGASAEKEKINSFLANVNNSSDLSETMKSSITMGNNSGACLEIQMFKAQAIKDAVQQKYGMVPPSLDTYEDIKDDLLQSLAHSTNVAVYGPSFIDWPDQIKKHFCLSLRDSQHKMKRGNQNTFINRALWKKEKIGNYEYDVIRLPETYGSTSAYHYDFTNWKWRSTKDKSDVPGELVVYAIKRGDYTIFIYPYYQNGWNYWQKSNDATAAKQQDEFLQKTMESIEFLK